MTTAQIEAGTLTANLEERSVTGLLLPYNEIGNTNLGKFEVPPGTVTLPRDHTVLVAKIGHGIESPVAPAQSLTDTAAGVVGTFKIADTDEGDGLLLDIASGKITKLSAEVKNIVLRAGKLVSGQLIGAAFVEKGAFPSAALMAEDVGDDAVTLDIPAEPTIPEPTPVVAENPATPNQEEETPVATATVPNTLQAAAVAKDAPVTKREALGVFEAIRSGNVTPEMLERLNPTLSSEVGMFALTDVKYTGSGSVQPDERRSQWIDEVWSGRTYVQKVLPLFNHKDLTAKVVSGFRWTTKPGGGDWAGNKANIPTNTPVTEAVTATAAFYAGGHDHAIEHQIFDTPGYFESYFAMEAEAYAEWADGKVLIAALAAATALEADNPSGLTIGAGWSALIDGAAAVIDANALPSFALIATALWKSMMKVPASDTLGYLTAALGLESGTLDGFVIRPHGTLTAGNILVGAKEAATIHELPGLIKVTAPDTVKGGIDTNVIGAAATVIHKATALQLVTPYTP